MAARPRTLPAAIAPVLVGTALAGFAGHVPAACVRRGAPRQHLHPDRDEPVERLLGRPPRRRHRGAARAGAGDRGRPRATAQGAGRDLARIRRRRRRRRYLIALAGWELLASGPHRYSPGFSTPAGPGPTATRGSASSSCSAFFGIVAVVGSYYVQIEELRGLAFSLAVPVGLLAAAILIVNNIRDVDTDRRAGKRTLAVRLGRAERADALRRDRVRPLSSGPRSSRSPAASPRSCWCCSPRRSPPDSCARSGTAPTVRR